MFGARIKFTLLQNHVNRLEESIKILTQEIDLLIEKREKIFRRLDELEQSHRPKHQVFENGDMTVEFTGEHHLKQPVGPTGVRI